MSVQKYRVKAQRESGWETVRSVEVKSPAGCRYKHAIEQQVVLKSGELEISVDLDRIIRQLGSRALLNSSGLSRSMNGAVVVKVVKREQDIVVQTRKADVPAGCSVVS